MAKKIPNVSRWGQDKARSRYQFGGMLPGQVNPAATAAFANRPTMPTMPTPAAAPPPAMAPVQAGLPAQASPQAAAALAARPALPAQAMGRRPFRRGGKAC